MISSPSLLILAAALSLSALGCTAKAQDRNDQNKVARTRPANDAQSVENSEGLGCYGGSPWPTWKDGRAQVSILSQYPVVKGYGLINQEVLAVTRANLNQIRDCYEQLLQRAPNATGTMGARLVVNASGLINSVKVINDTFGDNMMRGCLAGKIQHWVFQKPRNNSILEAQILFSFVDKLSQVLQPP